MDDGGDEEEESWDDIIQEVAQVPEYIREQNARGLEQFHERQQQQAGSSRKTDFKPKHFSGPRK